MPRPRLLVADDNPLSLRFFADALDALGIDSVLAADGEQALARADGGAFDALILDLRMPGLG
ncbi:MAG: response regulator, partial [Dokdonella sp.]|nr:response regulator [Dokdonella sp.]